MWGNIIYKQRQQNYSMNYMHKFYQWASKGQYGEENIDL